MNPFYSVLSTHYHDPQSPRHNPTKASPSQRPATIPELVERANIPWNKFKGYKYHLKLAEKYQRAGREYARMGDMENAFVELAKAATLVLERLPEHNPKLDANQRRNLALNGREILDSLAELKPAIVGRYEEWCQAQLDGADEYTSPNGSTQQLANNGQETFNNVDELSPGIVDRYENWCQTQLDDKPNVPTQQLANIGQGIVDDLNPVILDRYEKWCHAELDSVDEYTTPNTSTQTAEGARTNGSRGRK